MFMNVVRTLAIVSICLIAIPGMRSETQAKEGEKKYERSVEKIDLPDVTLLSQDRRAVRLRDLADSEQPVLLEFIFATCQTICPVMSAGFMNFQKELGEEAGSVRLVSISIDPQHDTPEVMRDYLERFRARPGWDFLTGEKKDIEEILRAFDCYVSNKMLHEPLTFMRKPGGEQWVRLHGLLSGSQLMKEYRALTPQ